MPTNTNYLNDLFADASYECVKQSPLWSLLQNHEADEASLELSEVLLKVANEWVEKRSEKLLAERMAETEHLELIGA